MNVGSAKPAGAGITIRGLEKKRYSKNGVPAYIFRGFDFRLTTGEVVAILGRNGSGKSTLLRILCGLDTDFNCTELSVSADLKARFGIVTPAISIYDPSTRLTQVSRPFIAVAVQDYKSVLLPWYTARENIELAVKLTFDEEDEDSRRGRVDEAIKSFLIEPLWAKQYPGTLSGGQAQRVVLARAFACEPSCMLLDEPFSALDFDIVYRLRAVVSSRLNVQKTSCLAVVHSIEDAVFLASRVVVLGPSHPTQAHKEYDIPFPMPRDVKLLDQPEYLARVRDIRDEVLTTFG